MGRIPYLNDNVISNLTDAGLSKIINPVTELVYVQVGDVGADYVSGSEGQLKTITEYQDVGKTILLSTTTFKYTDSTYPTQPTIIEVV